MNTMSMSYFRPFPSEEERRSSPNQERTVWKRPVRITWDRQDSEGSEQRSRSRSPVTLEQLNQRRVTGQDLSVRRERDTHFQRERHCSTDSHPRSPTDGGEQRGFVPFKSIQRERVFFSGTSTSERHILLKRNEELPDPRFSPVNHVGQGLLDRSAPEDRNNPRGLFQDEVGPRSHSPANMRAQERDYTPRPTSPGAFEGRSRSPTPERTLLPGNHPRFSSHKLELNSRVMQDQGNGPVVDYNHGAYKERPVQLHRGHPNARETNEQSLVRGHPDCGNTPRVCGPWRQSDFGMHEQGPRGWNPFGMQANARNIPPTTINAPNAQAFQQRWRAQGCPRSFQGILGHFPPTNLRPRMPFHQGPRRFPLGPNQVTRFSNNGRLPPDDRNVYDAEWNDDYCLF